MRGAGCRHERVAEVTRFFRPAPPPRYRILAVHLSGTGWTRYAISVWPSRPSADYRGQLIMADARAILSTVLYCAWWPTSKLLLAIRAILSPFWAILQFVFLPLIYLVHAILAVILLPFRLHLLERFEVTSFPLFSLSIWVSHECRNANATQSKGYYAKNARLFTYGLESLA